MADDNNKIAGDSSNDNEDLDAMLKALMNEDSQDDWKPDENFVDIIEGKTTDESEEEVEQEPETEKDDELPLYEPKEQEDEKKPSFLSGILSRFKKDKEDKEPKSKTTKIIYALSALAGLAVVAVVVLFLIDRFADDTPAPHALIQPDGRFNNAAFSSVELYAILGEEIIPLNQVLLDDAATVFYFGGNLDQTRFVFELQDFDGRVYDRDITFASNPWRQLILERTEIRFEAMSRDTEGFTLSITDLHSGYTASVGMTFDGSLIPIGRYISRPVSFNNMPVQALGATLNHAQFSASGSIIDLLVFHNFSDGGIVFSQASDTDIVSISHRGTFVSPVNNELQWLTFDENITLARMDFGPLRYLSGEVEIFLDGIYRRYDVGYTTPLTPLFSVGAARSRTIQLDANHQMTLHGMMRQGDLFVMPLYGTNQEQRVATTIHAYIVGTNAEGVEQRLPANVRYSSVGADALFDLTQNEYIARMPISQLHLEIEHVLVRLPQISQVIDLSDIAQINLQPSESRQNFENAIIEYFENISIGTITQVSKMYITGNNVHATVIQQTNNARDALMIGTSVHAVQGTVINGIFTPTSVQTAIIE
ncbi:MAG: hypothetical protein FWE44_06000 [Defluviitaleaceae bacterium]|nr:hypothetical protein [Defluviitaleaceae bacterium]